MTNDKGFWFWAMATAAGNIAAAVTVTAITGLLLPLVLVPVGVCLGAVAWHGFHTCRSQAPEGGLCEPP